jgi:hypothetical protein
MAIASEDDTYTIEPDGVGAFLVRVTQCDGGSRVIGGFPTWEAAVSWIVSARQTSLNGVPISQSTGRQP